MGPMNETIDVGPMKAAEDSRFTLGWQKVKVTQSHVTTKTQCTLLQIRDFLFISKRPFIGSGDVFQRAL